MANSSENLEPGFLTPNSDLLALAVGIFSARGQGSRFDREGDIVLRLDVLWKNAHLADNQEREYGLHAHALSDLQSDSE